MIFSTCGHSDARRHVGIVFMCNRVAPCNQCNACYRRCRSEMLHNSCTNDCVHTVRAVVSEPCLDQNAPTA